MAARHGGTKGGRGGGTIGGASDTLSWKGWQGWEDGESVGGELGHGRLEEPLHEHLLGPRLVLAHALAWTGTTRSSGKTAIAWKALTIAAMSGALA